MQVRCNAMIYVLSDIHGQARRFYSILHQIQLTSEDTLYVLGDVIDRNPDGIRILRYIMKQPNIHMLLGNHELMMLQSLYYPRSASSADANPDQQQLQRWYRNGGKITHDYLKHIPKRLRAEIFAYLDALPVTYTIEARGQTFTFVHAAPPDLYAEYGARYATEREFAVWWRQLVDIGPLEQGMVVFGHTTTHHYQSDNPMRIWYGNGLIGIDCGSSYPEGCNAENGYAGRLACLRLDDMKEFYSEE